MTDLDHRTVVLVVEPDPLLADALCDLLDSVGYAWRIAPSAQTARSMVDEQGNSIDIVAVDVATHHPGTQPLLDSLATFHGGVFVLSGNRSDESLATARGLPFLLMPFDADDFVAYVERQQEEPTRPGRLPSL
jgi:DNA-binding NtrC family response regulator